MMRGGLGNLMQQAQRMQEELQKQMRQAQAELAATEVTGQAGGGMVSVTMSCQHEARKVRIDPSLMSDAEMLEDLLAAAINDAVNKVAETSQARMAKVSGGLNLPAGLKLPF